MKDSAAGRQTKLPLTTERYVTPVYDPSTGNLLCWRISVDLVPDRIGGLKAGELVVVTISKRRKRR